MRTRLDVLCEIHKQKGGTIFDFERKYKMDFHCLTKDQFALWVKNFIMQDGPIFGTEFEKQLKPGVSR